MIDKAIAKITDEMMESNNPAIRHIEEHLTALATVLDSMKGGL